MSILLANSFVYEKYMFCAKNFEDREYDPYFEITYLNKNKVACACILNLSVYF